jgi:UDP-GlcNAc:undecaprenyl-phosphate GlcNAc-1-phosphate transferase
MPLELAFVTAFGATLLLTPLAIRLAGRTGFYDHPIGYKGHSSPTPYLGGAAVIGGLLVSSALFGSDSNAFVPIAVGAVVLCGVGTLDDRYGLGPLTRLVIEVAAAAVLFAAGIGWHLFASDAINLILSVVFVAGVVNAYNLMDNMDGATSTVAAVSGAGLGVLAAAQGSPELAAIGFALSGACAGFLPFNLASPSRIFLGDGGSMPIGFVVAGLIMAMPGAGHLGWAFVPVAVVLVGLPALDTTLVVTSRLRRGAGVFTGGRDHLTHRLRAKLGSARRVALVLGTSQALFTAAGSVLVGQGKSDAAFVSIVLILIGVAIVALLESPEWAPATIEWSAEPLAAGELALPEGEHQQSPDLHRAVGAAIVVESE